MDWNLLFQAVIATMALVAIISFSIAGIIWLIRFFQQPIEYQLTELKKDVKDIKKMLEKKS